MEYNYNADTLLHSVGFNFARFKSVLKYGILSRNKAVKLGISFTKNYIQRNNFDDYISLVAVKNVLNNKEEVGAYQIHSCYGINFIVEGVQYISDKKEFSIHHDDEVLVKDAISLDNIVGLAIPYEYLDMGVDKIQIIPPDITSYPNLLAIIDSYIKFLAEYNYHIDESLIIDYFREIYLTHKAIKSLSPTDILDFEELKNDYKELLRDINEILGEATYICFSRIINGKVSVKNLVDYLSKELYPIYNVPYNMLDTIKKR